MSDLSLVEGGVRQKGIHIIKPIVYGNVSKYFGKKREEDGHTHQWTVYVKPYRNEVTQTKRCVAMIFHFHSLDRTCQPMLRKSTSSYMTVTPMRTEH